MTGLSTTNRAIEKASRVLEGLESDAADHSRDILEDGSKRDPKAAIYGGGTGSTDPFMNKIILDRESRKKYIFDAASASQQVSFMEWLGEADEEEANSLLTGEDVDGVSFYDEVHKMMEVWVQLNWLDTKQGKALARQACILGADLPLFSIDELKKL